VISEPIPFLANIILVAHADGNLSPVELEQIELIRNELNVKKGDLKEASKLVEQGSYTLTPVGSFADQVKNFEMMFRVAYCDNNLEKTEGSILIEFCKSIGLTRDQLNIIKEDVLNLLKQQIVTCLSCGATITSDVKFCGKCGVSLTKQVEKTQSEIKIPNSGLAFKFPESAGASFPKALEVARISDDFQTCKINKKNWYLAVFESNNISDVMPMVEALKGIRNRQIFIDGKEMDWNEVFAFKECIWQRSRAYQPNDYCFGKEDEELNPWGCVHTNMSWIEGSELFIHGNWEEPEIPGGEVRWRLDKDKIQNELEMRLHRYRFCPHIKMELCAAVLKYLPEVVAPDSDPLWSYNEDYEGLPGSIKISVEDYDGEIEEVLSNGVKPIGYGQLELILFKAFDEMGIKDISIKNLIK
jgi:hypothetical protein